MIEDADTLKARCAVARGLSLRAAALLEGNYGSCEKESLAFAAISLAHEHHSAFIRLMESGHFASAAALLRPIAEAGAFAYWIMYAANSDHMVNLRNDGDPPTIDRMITALAKSGADIPDIKTMRNLLQTPHWRRFHQFTHGGMIQLKRRKSEATFDLLENINHVMLADTFLLTAVALATVMVKENADLVAFSRQEMELLNGEAASIFGAKKVEWRPLPQPMTEPVQ